MANGPRKELSFLDKALMDKAATQGGVLNFLGQQPQVTAPIKAQSHADSPPTQLAYITDAEKDLLVKANIHGSLAGKPNPGPAGIESLDDFFTTPGGGISGGSTSNTGGSVGGGGSGGGGTSAEDYGIFGGGKSGQQFGGAGGAGMAVGSDGTVYDQTQYSGPGINFNQSLIEVSPEEQERLNKLAQEKLDASKPEPEEKKTKDKKSKVKAFKDWFDDNIFGQPIGSGNLVTQAALEKLKEFKKLDVGLFKSFMLNRGNIIGSLFKDQTYSDMEGNIINPESVSEGPEGMKGLNEDGEIVDVRYTKEGFNDLMKDTFGKGIFETLKKEYPEEYYPYAGTPQTSGGLVNLAGIDATKFGSRTLPDGSPNPNYNPDFANMIFGARAELDRMGKNPMTGNPQGGGQVAGFPGIPGIPSLPVPRPGPIPPDSYPLPPTNPWMPGPGLPPWWEGSKFEKPAPYDYYAQSPQYKFGGVPSLNTNEFNEQLRKLYGTG